MGLDQTKRSSPALEEVYNPLCSLQRWPNQTWGKTNCEQLPFCTNKWLTQSFCMMESRPAHDNQGLRVIKMLFSWPSLSRSGLPLSVAIDGVQVSLVSLEIEKSPQRWKPLLALGDLCPGSPWMPINRIHFGPRHFRHYLVTWLINLIEDIYLYMLFPLKQGIRFWEGQRTCTTGRSLGSSPRDSSFALVFLPIQ